MQPRQLKSMLNSGTTDQYWCRPFRVLSGKKYDMRKCVVTELESSKGEKQNSKHTLKTGSWHLLGVLCPLYMGLHPLSYIYY